MGTYYKVLVDGKSCHGGDMQWSLPVQQEDGTWLPGEEMRVEGTLSLCSHGLHLTTKPDRWWKPGCLYYEAEITGDTGQTEDDKTVVSACRLLRETPVPDYLQQCEALITEIKGVKWFSQAGPIDPAWKMFTAPTLAAARAAAGEAAWKAAWEAAREAAWDAAWKAAWKAAGAAAGAAAGEAAREAARKAAREAAREAAWEATWDARLYTLIAGICADLPIDQCHRDHARDRMEVWRRGYGLICDIDGVLYVYGVNKED